MGRHEEALKILHGGTVIPAIPLVLDENRKFNEAGQRTLIRYYLDAGVGGLAVAVHTTQFEIRKPEVGLFEPVLRVTKEEMDAYEARTGKTLVRVAGACGEAEQACAEARTAKAHGKGAGVRRGIAEPGRAGAPDGGGAGGAHPCGGGRDARDRVLPADGLRRAAAVV